MAQTTVSSKYQVVIPKEIRERLGLRPGHKLSVLDKGGVIYLLPLPELQDLRGVARGANTDGIRQKDDRL